MTAHDPRVTLTEAEYRLLDYAVNATDCGFRDVTETVEHLIAARLAPIRALAGEWSGTRYKLPFGHPMDVNEFCRQWFLHPLLAALHAPASASQDHDGAEGQADAHQAALADHFEAMTPEQRRAAINVPRRPR